MIIALSSHTVSKVEYSFYSLATNATLAKFNTNRLTAVELYSNGVNDPLGILLLSTISVFDVALNNVPLPP